MAFQTLAWSGRVAGSHGCNPGAPTSRKQVYVYFRPHRYSVFLTYLDPMEDLANEYAWVLLSHSTGNCIITKGNTHMLII